jgi:perosamine synthetase
MLKSARDSDNRWGLCHGYGSIYGTEEMAEMGQVMLDWAPTNDSKVREFEVAFARYTGAARAIAVSSCAAALHLSAIALGIGPGDEVLVPPLTFVATANAFAITGARIRFVDVEPTRLMMDPTKLASMVNEKTRAIVPVDLYGDVADLDPIRAIGREHNIPVVEDAAHSLGADRKGKRVGSLAEITAFSFQRAKNMSTLGEGGMLTTEDERLADLMTSCRQHGEGRNIGLNYRMTDVQAAAGVVQLTRRLDQQNDKRRELARHYTTQLSEIDGITLPLEFPEVKHVFHLYTIRVDPQKLSITRDDIIRRMKEQFGIWCIVQYPCVHLLEVYRKLGHREGECPVAEQESERLLCLPINPRLSFEDVDFVVKSLKHVLAEASQQRSNGSVGRLEAARAAN